MASSDKHLKLLVYGYVREVESVLNLFMNIPDGIIKLIYSLYPLLLFKFGDFKAGLYDVNDDKTILKGTKQGSCNGHVIYADLSQYSDKGLNKGIHLWTIKFLANYPSCFASMGVTTQKSDKLINNWCHDGGNTRGHYLPDDNQYDVYYQGYSQWYKNEIVTMKLNCNDWTVTWFKDKKEIQKKQIEPHKFYYLALMCCGNLRYTHLQIMESEDV